MEIYKKQYMEIQYQYQFIFNSFKTSTPDVISRYNRGNKYRRRNSCFCFDDDPISPFI